MDYYERCWGCRNYCYLSNPRCHVGRDLARERMYEQNSQYGMGMNMDWLPPFNAWDANRLPPRNAWEEPRRNEGRDGWDVPGRQEPPRRNEPPRWDEPPLRNEPPRWDEPPRRDEPPRWDEPRPREGQPRGGWEEPPRWGDPRGPELRGDRRGRPRPRGGRRSPMGAPDDEFLIHSFHHCAHLLMHRRGKESASSRAIMVLERRGKDGLSQRELAESLDIRSASVSQLLTKMEDLGLITRTPDPDDKRAVLINLTEKGHERAEQVALRRKEANRNLFAVLNGEEKEQLRVILEKLTRFWHEEFNREDMNRQELFSDDEYDDEDED